MFLRDPSNRIYASFKKKKKKKNTENSEWLGQKAQPVSDLGTSRLPVLRAEPACKKSIVTKKKSDYKILVHLHVSRYLEFNYAIFIVMYICVPACVYA